MTDDLVKRYKASRVGRLLLYAQEMAERIEELTGGKEE